MMHNGQTMGTHYSVKWWGNASTENENLVALFDQRLLEINQTMSTYIEDSELSKFNRLPVNSSTKISESFSRVMRQALDIAERSQGAFDFTVGPLVDLWGFGSPGERTGVPDESEISAILPRIGFQNISLQAGGAQLSKQRQSEIDLSAIAKGYAVDSLASVLDDHGFENYLVEIGGELRARGAKPADVPWRAGIEAPQDQGRFVQDVFELHNITKSIP